MRQYLLAILLLTFTAICVSQLTFSITNQCTCSQYDQSECTQELTFGFCNWNTLGRQCQQSNCTQFTNSTQCLLSFDKCSWNGVSCQGFSFCSNLTATTNLSCSQQNLQCSGTNSTCVEISSLPQCSTYSSTQCGQPTYEFGYKGTVCVLQNNKCQAASTCSVITNETICTQQQFSCQWNNGTCVQQQCSSFKTEQDCQFIFQNLNYEKVQTCIYQYGSCQPMNSIQQLNSADCSSKSLYNYHWIQGNSTGYCLPCSFTKLSFNAELNYYNPSNECPCEFFTSQTSCNQASKCTWNKSSQCQEITCAFITDQLSCISNQNCFWNNTCQEFQGCGNFTATSKNECLLHSFNCKAFNAQNNQCLSSAQVYCNQYQYNSYYCLYYTSGLCYYNTQSNQCLQVSSCSLITNYQYCEQYKYACKWEGQQCKPLTCLDFLQQEDCNYMVVNVYTNDIEPCAWNSALNKCYPLVYPNSLTSSTCQSSSLSTFYWAGSSCLRCQQVTAFQFSALTLPDQCSCSQLHTEYECQQSKQCSWQNTYCSYASCPAITYEIFCRTNPECVWQNDRCSYFTTCQSLKGTNQQECEVQSINCLASNGVNCQGLKYLKSCSAYSQSECYFSIGTEGLCMYNTEQKSCQLISQCSQILTKKWCLYAQHQCVWINDLCSAASCSTYASQSACTFYTSSLNSPTAITCVWNSSKSVCVQSSDYVNQLNALTCYQNTDRTARWLVNQCISCKQHIIPNQFQCSCSQLISQINCEQMTQCTWNTTAKACQQQSCTNLTHELCIQNSQCMWLKKSCAAFTSCSQLTATGLEECLAQSLYCPVFNPQTKLCQSQGLNQDNVCQYYDKTNCQIEHSYYSCIWNTQTNNCDFVVGCQGYGLQQCNQKPLCFYSQYYGCQYKQCSDYIRKIDCTYVLNFENSNILQSCIWVKGQCITKTTENRFDAESCLSSTAQTSRWSSNTTKGYCISCLPTFFPVKPLNQCACSQLLNQFECQRAGCNWDQNYCQTECSQISTQSSCVGTQGCYWDLNRYACTYFSFSLPGDACQTLQGQNSLECLAQSLDCPVSLNGICQNKANLQTCQSIQTVQECVNGLGQEGYCNYENQSCKVLTSCTQIKSQQYCSLMSKTCEWNTTTGYCQKMFCSSFSSQSQCSYVYQSVNTRVVQLCQWNTSSSTCESAPYAINKTQQNCYLSSGGTYHWSSNNSNVGYCVTCAINLVQPQQRCSCKSLTETECYLAQPQCRWNSKSCEQVECNALQDSINCAKLTNCMWQNGQCTTFTSCSNLTGTNTFDCLAQSNQCGAISGTTCSSSKSACSSQYTTVQTCAFGVVGSNGFCYWNSQTTTCDQLVSCNQVTAPTQCSLLLKACKWSTYFSNCVPAECQDYINIEQCTYVLVNLQDTGVQLCEWYNGVCQPFKGKYFGYDEESCFQKSDQTYRWADEDKHGVECQQCSHSYLIMSILIHLLVQVLF